MPTASKAKRRSVPPSPVEELHRTIKDLHLKIDEHKETIRGLEAMLAEALVPPECARPHLERVRLPDERASTATKTFRIGPKHAGVSAHVHVGEYADGRPGELFVRLGACMDRSVPDDQVDWQGLAIRLGYVAKTFADAHSTAVSVGVQHGIPICLFLAKHIHQQDFAGFTGDEKYPRVSGLLDYISRWLKDRYCPKEEAPDDNQP